jgi:hypothetical protein
MSRGSQETFHQAGDAFYMMIGQCIAEWASVDDELFNIFQDSVGPREQCAIIYFKIQSLSTRFDLTDEIVKSVLPKPDRPKKEGGHDHPSVKAWGIAKGDYQELLSTRSRIAHHPVEIGLELRRARTLGGQFGTQTFNSPGIAPPRTWFELSASSKERMRERSANLKPLRIEDLRDHLSKVVSLRLRLREFFENVLTKSRG